MTDASKVAIVSVLVAGVTSITAPVLAARTEARRAEKRQALDERLKDVDELRLLLLEAVAALHEVERIVNEVFDSLFGGITQSEADKASKDLWAKRWPATIMKSRLAIHVGPQTSLLKKFEVALKGSERLSETAQRASTDAVSGALSPQAVFDRHDSFQKTLQEFLDEAHKWAGLQSIGDDSPGIRDSPRR